MKSVFANSKFLEIIGEIAGERCQEFYICDDQNLDVACSITRPFTFKGDKTHIFLSLTETEDEDDEAVDEDEEDEADGDENEDEAENDYEVKLKLQTDNSPSVVIDSAMSTDSEGCDRLKRKIGLLCAALV